MSTQSTLTVTGFVGSSVRFSVGSASGVPYASFRLGCTQRVRDHATGTWKDAPTEWYTVKAWRQVATNVVQSLRKGDPVVVTGKLRTEEWDGPEGHRVTLIVEATALGHDLVFGTTKFERTLAPGARGEGAPVDVSTLTEAPGEGGEPGDDEPGEEVDEDELDEDDLHRTGNFEDEADAEDELDEAVVG